MKRAALGVLLISLVAGSAAMAGTVLASAGERHRAENRHDNRQHDRGRERHDDRRNNGRRDDNWNRRDGHRNDGRNDGRRDNHWDGRRDDRRDDGRRFDDHRRHEPPRYAPAPRRYDPPRLSSRAYSGRRFENGRWHWGSYYRPHGYYVRHWVRGDRLPRAYYGPTYVVSNYYDCGLRHPPHGYHWVRVDHDVILAAVATGIVLDVVYNQFW